MVAAPALAQEVVEVHLFHVGHTGATAIQFKVQVSNPNWTHLGDDWNFSAVIGSSVSGVAIGYGACMSAPTHLGVALFYATEITCSDLQIVADPSTPSGQIEVVDCAGILTYPTSAAISASYAQCGVNPPGTLQPPDSAVGVSLNPTLTWTWEGSTNCPEGLGMITFGVYLGTDPGDLTRVGGPFPSGPMESWEFTAGPLPGATRHYWRVKVRDEWWSCPGSHEAWSTTQSFLTLGAVPVEHTTWGRIKGLYR